MATVNADRKVTYTVTLDEDEAAQLLALLGITSGEELDSLYNAFSRPETGEHLFDVYSAKTNGLNVIRLERNRP